MGRRQTCTDSALEAEVQDEGVGGAVSASSEATGKELLQAAARHVDGHHHVHVTFSQGTSVSKSPLFVRTPVTLE